MIPVFDVSRLIGFLKTLIVTFALFSGIKALLIASMTILVPFAIYKAFTIISEKGMAFVSLQLAGNEAWQGTFVQLTGLAGWMGERLQLQACFQILATFIVMRYIISFVHKG